MNLLLVSQHIIFDESSFPFASSDMLPNDLNSLFSSSHAPRLTPMSTPVPMRSDTPACATRGTGVVVCVFVHDMHGLSFTLHPTPWCTSDYFRSPRWSPPATSCRSTTLSPWQVTPQHPPNGHLSCCRSHQARGLSTTLRRHYSHDTFIGPDLCPLHTHGPPLASHYGGGL
jgi:hypothetical protein